MYNQILFLVLIITMFRNLEDLIRQLEHRYFQSAYTIASMHFYWYLSEILQWKKLN